MGEDEILMKSGNQLWSKYKKTLRLLGMALDIYKGKQIIEKESITIFHFSPNQTKSFHTTIDHGLDEITAYKIYFDH